MRGSLRKSLSLLLSLVMVLSLVPATVFAAQATTETPAGAAVNASTGAVYAAVSEACDEAEAGQTIKLTCDSTEDTVVVDEGITLDLAGFALKVDYMVCYGAIIDSSEGTAGLLTVPANHLVLEDTNPQLPVKDSGGYRFVEIIGYNSTMVNENKYAFQPLFEADAHQYLASGTAASGVSIQVDVTWKANGNTIHAYFSYSDDLVKGYVDSYKPESGKYGKMFTLTKQSTGYYEDLGFEAIVISESDVRIGAGISKPATPDDGKVEVDSNNRVVNDVTIYDSMGSATIQAGTQLEDASAELKLNTKPMDTTGTDITLSNGEEMQSFDVHVSGISKDNTVPVIITLKELAPEFLNKGNLDLYHVENGVTVPMTRVYTLEEVDAHNEYYYDIATGTVTLAMATFSEISARSVTANPWNGNEDHTWYDADATELTIANADQLWSFSQIVGGMAVIDGEKVQDSFEGKTVKLIADINLDDGELSNDPDKVFYPIGYYNSEYTYAMTGTKITSGVTAFQGTFDGLGHTIKNFYQSTWEMKGDDPYYAASEQRYNDAMGLFSATFNATVKNLVIENFSCDGEFTPTGCVVAYAGGNSAFENITLRSCNPRVYNTGNGGIVGLNYCSTNGTADQLTFKNITVDNTNKITALWGSWDVACGGIVGRIRENSKHDGTNTVGQMNTVSFENCHVAAQIDVYNDVCANYQYYQYRYSGMMVGTIDYMDEIPGVSLKDMFTATGCTVHFGDWNEYWYCELVENSLASYTHDHQFSRLEKIESIDDIYKNGEWTRAGNFVIPAENEADAVCYHIRNVNGELVQHKHEDAGFEKTLPSSYDPAGYDDWDKDGDMELLLEDRQHYMLPFREMCAGYGWGASHEYLWGDAINGGIVVLDYENPESVTKFTAVPGSGASYDSGVTVKIGDLFTAVPNLDKLAIDVDNVEVTVSPADDNSTASGTYTANDQDWTQGTLTFSGVGSAQIIIQDYYFCVPTYLTLNIEPAVKLELVSHPVNSYTDLNDSTHAEGTKAYVQLSSVGELPLAAGSSVDVAVPAGWTFKSDIGTYADGKLTVTNAQTVSKENLVLGTFVIAQPDQDITGWTVNGNGLKVMGAKSEVAAVVTLTAQGEGHNGDEWIAWGDEEAEWTSLPKKTGRYYLTHDVELPKQVELSGESLNVELCLNGQTIKANVPEDKLGTAEYRDRMYYVRNGAKLTICDCTACGNSPENYTAGKLVEASNGAIMIPNLKTYVDNHGRTVVNLYDGIIRDNTLIDNGGSVLAQQYATFNMYGGLITNNRNEFMGDEDSAGGQGAAVYAGSNATFNMYGGWITNNVANKGAGLWCTGSSTVNIKNGYFAGNSTWQDDTDKFMHKAGDSGYTGEDLATRDIYFTYNPDDKTYHYGSGAAIYAASATVNVENTVFENNEAWIRGGAITLTNYAELTLIGGRFEGNKVLTYKYREIVPEVEEPQEPVQTLAENETENNSGNNVDDELGGGSEGETGGSEGGGGEMGEGTTTSDYKIQESTGCGGAIFLHGNSVLNVTGTVFNGNIADLNGGAVNVIGGSTAVLENATITNNEIHSNGGAGVYYAGYSKLTIQGEGTQITGNYGGLPDRTAVAGVYLTNGFGQITVKGSPIIDGNGYGTSPENILHERNVYLQDNTGRTYDHDNDETTAEIPTPDAKLRIRNLTPGTNITVFNSNGKAAFPTLGYWLDWKDTEAFDSNNKETYYGSWLNSYIRLTHSTLATQVIWENKDSYELYMLDDHDANHAPVEGEGVTWQPWFKTDSLPTESGYYYLTENVTLAAAQQLTGTKNVNLCLRGHSVTANGDRIYDVANTAQLTICDCTVAVADAESNTTIGTLYTGTGEGGAIKAASGTTVNLTNVKVTGKRTDGTQVEEIVNGGAIHASSATVNMTDVIFTNVRVMGQTTLAGVHTGRGGVIFAGAATKLAMTNVIIDECSGGMGAVLYFDGTAGSATLTMNNVTVQNCESDAAKAEGESISAKPIGNNYSEIIHLDDVAATMNQCRIINNTTWDSLRGPVYLCINTVVTMTDCTIIGNRMLHNEKLTAENYGAIYMTQPAKLVLNGNNNVIADNYHYTYDSATGNAADCKREINIFLQRNSGTENTYPYVEFTNITDTTYQAKIDASNTLDDNNLWNSYWSAENCVNFTVFQTYSGSSATKANYTYLYNGTTFVKVDGTHPGLAGYHKDDCADSEWKAWTSTTTVPSTSGYYYLTQDVTVTARTEIKTSQNITLCLNGHSISCQERANDTSNYNDILYHLTKGTINLTICDCTARGDATQGIYHAEDNPDGYKAGTISSFTDSVLFTPGGSNIDNSNVTINIRDGIFTNNCNDYLVKENGVVDRDGSAGGVIVLQLGATANITGGLFTGNNAASSAGVIYATNSNVKASNAVFSNNSALETSGAVIYAGSSEVELTNCTFTKNTATTAGGAIHAYGTSKAVLTNCTFTENTATTAGGAILVTDTAKLEATNCAFTYNQSSDYGGACHFTENADVQLTNCTFDHNSATNNGGALNTVNTIQLTVTGGTFSNNVSGKYGGAIYSAGGETSDKTFTLTNVTFSNNTSGYGGAVYTKYRAAVAVNGCTFTGNTANVYLNNEEAIGGLGGAICADSCTLTVSGGSFTGNTAGRYGGAIFVTATSLTITGTCSITGNSVGDANYYAGRGGGIYVKEDSSLTLGADVTVNENTLIALSNGTTGLGKDIYLVTGAGYTDNGANVGEIYPPQSNEGGQGGSEVEPETP